jgi:hypothetical protein
MADQVGLIGEHLGWSVEDSVSLSNTNTTHVVCTNASTVYIHCSHAIDISFTSAEADCDDNDIELAAGLHSFIVPKAVGNATILNYRRASGTTTTVRVVLS